MSLSRAQAGSIMDRTRKDPEWWVEEVLGDEPWSGQVAVLESVRDNRVTCVPSCHSAGKDWIAARVALWFVHAYCPSKVVTTAPTDRQVKKILWSEISSAVRDANLALGGRMMVQEYNLDKDWFMLGFASPDYDPNKFQASTRHIYSSSSTRRRAWETLFETA